MNQFDYSCNFRDRKILKLVPLDFEGYASFWWNKYQKDIIDGKHFQNTWKYLKKVLRKRFMPLHEKKEEQEPYQSMYYKSFILLI